MCTCSWLCKGLCTGVQYPQRPEEGIRPPRARISGCLTWVLRTELGSSTRTIHTFNSRAISPALPRPFLWRGGLFFCFFSWHWFLQTVQANFVKALFINMSHYFLISQPPKFWEADGRLCGDT